MGMESYNEYIAKVEELKRYPSAEHHFLSELRERLTDIELENEFHALYSRVEKYHNLVYKYNALFNSEIAEFEKSTLLDFLKTLDIMCLNSTEYTENQFKSTLAKEFNRLLKGYSEKVKSFELCSIGSRDSYGLDVNTSAIPITTHGNASSSKGDSNKNSKVYVISTSSWESQPLDKPFNKELYIEYMNNYNLQDFMSYFQRVIPIAAYKFPDPKVKDLMLECSHSHKNLKHFCDKFGDIIRAFELNVTINFFSAMYSILSTKSDPSKFIEIDNLLLDTLTSYLSALNNLISELSEREEDLTKTFIHNMKEGIDNYKGGG